MKTKNILISWARPPVSDTADGIAVESVANQRDVRQWPKAPGQPAVRWRDALRERCHWT
jgi:hypothetical protein